MDSSLVLLSREHFPTLCGGIQPPPERIFGQGTGVGKSEKMR